MRGEQCRHHRDIEQNRPCRGGGKLLDRIQHCRKLHRGNRHDQIGKGDAGQHSRQIHLAGMRRKAGRHRRNHVAHTQKRCDQQDDLRHDLPGIDRVGEACRRLRALPVVRSLAKRGRNAALKAPSPKMARKLLGRRNATRNASDIGPAPKTNAIKMSRINPVTRESAV